MPDNIPMFQYSSIPDPLAVNAAPKAVVLLSGGLDSATTMAIAKADGCDVYALSFSYGQRHDRELDAAKKVCQSLGGVEHKIIKIDLRAFGGSALTDDLDVPKNRNADEMVSGIPVTYVPARNTIFLSFSLAYAEVIGAGVIYTGVNAVDYSGYPDCRPEFISAFEQLANLATKAGVEGHRLEVRTPLIEKTKAEIIGKGLELGVDYALTWSCYDPLTDDRACGRCDSCLLRRKGFADAGVRDPIMYAH